MTTNKLKLIAPFAILALAVAATLLAISLRSYLQPVIIMGVIPFGFICAVFGHMVLGLPISNLSLFGILALAGVVVNASCRTLPTVRMAHPTAPEAALKENYRVALYLARLAPDTVQKMRRSRFAATIRTPEPKYCNY